MYRRTSDERWRSSTRLADSAALRARSSSAKRQCRSWPTAATATAAAWISAHFHGPFSAASWLYIVAGSIVPITPWLSSVNRMAQTKVSQSWYSAMKPRMMKKWKWASIVPPEKWTTTAEA